MLGRHLIQSTVAGIAILISACSSNPTTVTTDPSAQLMSVSPRGGSAGVSMMPSISLTFSQPMAAGMERYVALHRGGLTGPTMPMTCNWSDGQKTVTCSPNDTLASGTYSVKLDSQAALVLGK